VVSQTAAQISRQLFDSTVSHEGVRRFLIVPDGPLHLLPFALLPALHGYSIACLPSASVLVERLRGDTQAKTYRPVLVLAGSTPYAMQEATNIRQLVNSKDLEMKSGRAASRSIFNQPELVHFGLIHIASHAVVDLEHPENTGVELADGRLTAQRILSVSLNARLATLSACETASGKPVAGEGLMGLTRSFLYAGAHMVLAALWQVDDQATAQFMGYFYRSLLQEGQPAAVAVRAAQDRMRSQPRWSNPYYWAAFTLQGDWK
jgi:CHAT domain-containing protein